MEGSVSKAEWIQSRVNDHTEEIIAFLNPLELLPYLDKHGLVSHDDKEVLLNDRITRRKKVLCILKALENKGTCSAYTDFLECLTEEVHRREGIHIICWHFSKVLVNDTLQWRNAKFPKHAEKKSLSTGLIYVTLTSPP